MSDATTGLSSDEQDKIAAYHKAMTDRQSGVVKVADRVPAAAGMAATGEMPSAAMRADRPMASALSSLVQPGSRRDAEAGDECRNRGCIGAGHGRDAAPANEPSLVRQPPS